MLMTKTRKVSRADSAGDENDENSIATAVITVSSRKIRATVAAVTSTVGRRAAKGVGPSPSKDSRMSHSASGGLLRNTAGPSIGQTVPWRSDSSTVSM